MAEPTAEFLRQEYSEISKYIVELVRTRFVVFGAFLAGAITLVSAARTPDTYLFGLAAVCCVVVIDLRNRILLSELALRAISIEASNLIGLPETPLPFWTLQHAKDPDFLALAGVTKSQIVGQRARSELAYHRSVRFLRIPLHSKIFKFITHSFAMDSAYAVFSVIMVWELIKVVVFHH